MGRYSNFIGATIDLTSLTLDRPLSLGPATGGQSRFPKLGGAELEALAADYLGGVPVNVIATKYAVSRSTVRARIDSMGLERRLPRLSADEKVAIIGRFECGESKNDLASEFGVSIDTISRTIRIAKRRS
jgi:hypothetical protein